MNPSNRRRIAGLALVLAAGVAGITTVPHAQEETEEMREIERLTEWPPLSAEARREVATNAARLRKARTETMATEARVALQAMGAGAAPTLLKALGKEKDAAARGRIEKVLEAITGPPHTRLLTACFADRRVEVRRWSLRRVATFPDPGTRKAAQAAWEKVAARARKDAARTGAPPARSIAPWTSR